MGLYGALPGATGEIGITLVSAALGAELYANSRSFSEFRESKKLEIIDLETGKVLPEMKPTADNTQVSESPGCGPRGRIIFAVAFTTAMIALGVLWKTQNWPWNDSLGTTSGFIMAPVGFWLDFIANFRWKTRPKTQPTNCISWIIKNNQFFLSSLAAYINVNGGWGVPGGILSGGIYGYLYGKNRSVINAGYKDELPTGAFVSTGTFIKLLH